MVAGDVLISYNNVFVALRDRGVTWGGEWPVGAGRYFVFGFLLVLKKTLGWGAGPREVCRRELRPRAIDEVQGKWLLHRFCG